MTRERWERLAPLVDAVLDQPSERRAAYVAEISGGDAMLAEELTRFVSADGHPPNETPGASLFAAANHERSALMSERLRDSAVNLQAQLEASLGASYVVEREIGGGGMARVFVAEEPGLGRKVVIKVLPPEMSEGISAERFAREIKLAASLQQANIVPVLATGTAAGFPFYIMPFVEGRSLRERLLREGALPVNDAISILRDVARALTFAHSRGVIHRDIKPGNILLSDRTAVVTDFGIAKALGVAREQARTGVIHESASHTGTLGTPAYMAPEQASGDPTIDHRADIYSFGCVAYELLTGKPPFVGAAPHEVIAAQFHETPRPVTELQPKVPAAIADLIASCLEKEPSRRPQSAEAVLRALDEAPSQAIALAPRLRRKTLGISTVILVAGVVAALGDRELYSAFRRKEPPAVRSAADKANPAAFDLYRIGQVQLGQRGAGIAKAIENFQSAIDLDSNFARAHAALANALGLGPFFIDGPPGPLIARSLAEARRALALDSTLADAYVALGNAHAYAGEWEASNSAYGHAIDLEPDNAMARQTFARNLIVRGEATQGIEQLQRASKSDPTSPLISAWMAYAFFLEGRRDSALAQSERTTQLGPTLSANANLGALLNLGLGRNDAARSIMDMMVGPAMTNAPYVHAKVGDTAKANRLVRELEARNPRPWYVDVAKATVFLATGDTAHALTALERSSRDTGPLWVFYIPLGDPAFDPVRKSRRFEALLRKANIKSRVVTNPRRQLTAETTNAAALDYYGIGQVQLGQRGTGIARAVENFQRAIDLDSNFARARAGLAVALSFAPAYLDGPLNPAIKRSVEEAKRALALDSSLADAYLALGKAKGYAGEWEASDSLINRAITLEKNGSQARQTLARHLMLRGHPAEAIEQFERARTVDPTSAIPSAWLAYAFFLERRRDSAIAQIERANQLDTTLLASANLGSLLNLGLGRKDSARKLVSIPAGRAMPNAPYVYEARRDGESE